MSAVQSYGDMAMMQAMGPASAAPLQNTANVDKAAQDFEAMFVTQMLQPMFEGVGVDPTFGGGHGEEIMRTFLLQEYGKIVAKSGQLGIAPAIKNEMIKAQAVGRDSKPTATNRQKGALYAANR